MAKKKQELTSEELLAEALVREEDWPYEVPGNWVWVRLGSIISVSSGKSLTSSKMNSSGKIPVYGGNGITGYHDISNIEADNIVLGRVGYYCGSVHYIFEPSWITDNALVVSFERKWFNIKFMFWLLNILNLRKNDSSTAQPVISGSKIYSLEVPLPPLAEQQRIVDRIESLFDKLDQAKDLIQDALDSFETRKAAILHQAFTGQLTKKWREAHSNIRNTTLHDIKEYAEGLPKKQKNQILNAQEFVKIKELNDGNIWYESTIGAVGLVTNGSTPSRACLEYWNGDIPWVSSGEVRNNIIGFSKECISQKGYENSSVKLLPKGTVLIAMIGEGKTRGQSAVLDIPATTNQNIAAIIIDHGYISSNFLWYWLQKEYQNNREKGNGTGPQALNCQRVRELKFVLPSFLEQREIVRILDDLFAKEQNAKDLIDLIDQIEAIKKTILGQAFRGELGTNEAGEENAVALLKDMLNSK